MATDSQYFDFESLVGAEEYSDMKIKCQGREFKVHKVVVCTQSPVLAAALRGPFEVHLTGSSALLYDNHNN